MKKIPLYGILLTSIFLQSCNDKENEQQCNCKVEIATYRPAMSLIPANYQVHSVSYMELNCDEHTNGWVDFQTQSSTHKRVSCE